jgi:hypothetical protein
MENKLREKIIKILKESRDEDWHEDFDDPSADERRVETFNDDYAVDKLLELFSEFEQTGRTQSVHSVEHTLAPDGAVWCANCKYILKPVWSHCPNCGRSSSRR